MYVCIHICICVCVYIYIYIYIAIVYVPGCDVKKFEINIQILKSNQAVFPYDQIVMTKI